MGNIKLKTASEVSEENKQQLIKAIGNERKNQEELGITYNDIRYAGSPDNRQTIAEAIQFANDSGVTVFPSWKDSDNKFHTNLPVVDVENAYRLIGQNRTALIAKEAEYIKLVNEGIVTDTSQLDWEV